MRQTGGEENGEIHGTPAMGKPSEESAEERNLNKAGDTKVQKCKESWLKAAQTA